MLRIRIVAAGAFLFAVSLIMSPIGASAQTAPGKPIQLLPTAGHTAKARTKFHGTKSHGRKMSRRLGRSHFAAKKSAKRERIRESRRAREKAKHPVETAKAALPPNVWPGLGTAAPSNFASAEPSAPRAMPESASADPRPSELVVGGRTVDIVPINQANEMDLAAAGKTAAPVAAATATPTATNNPAAPEPAGKVLFLARMHGKSPVGSTSWIAKVAAALGGAVAAGSLAWFLIGSAPQRTYG